MYLKKSTVNRRHGSTRTHASTVLNQLCIEDITIACHQLERMQYSVARAAFGSATSAQAPSASLARCLRKVRSTAHVARQGQSRHTLYNFLLIVCTRAIAID